MHERRRRTPVLGILLAVGLQVGAAYGAPSPKEQEREALRKALREVIAQSPLGAARVSIKLVSLDDGSVVFAQNPDELLNPASNVKLVTAAAALARLGLDYRFETEFLTDDQPKDGKTRVLYVRGKGDPSMTTEKLWGVASELAHTGLKEVSGDLIVDESFFDADRVPPGYDQERSDRSYMAPPGGLSLNWNAVGVYLRPGPSVGSPGVVEIEPPSDYFVVDNRLRTGSRLQRRFWVSSQRDKDGLRQNIAVTGAVPFERGSWSMWKKIDEPGLYFGYTLKEMLALKGVKVRGRVKAGLTPSNARILHVAQSDTFDLVLKRLNKNSSNFVAENLIKTLGAEVKGAPGTTAKGIEAVEEFLESEVGLPRGSYVMKNGSGLNDTNRFSAAQLVRVLHHMYHRFALNPEYLSALTIAGKDGTLKYRFDGSDAVGRLRAKTGTLENVSALSGFVQAVGGERFIFSVLVNDFPGRAGTVVKHIDALGAAVAATGSALGPDRAVAALTSADAVVRPMNDVKTRVKTFVAMGAQQDKRNVTFLHTAWRSEKDPAVRAVVADAMYLSNPQDSLGSRMLIDSFTAGDEVYGRLRKVAAELKIEVPGLGSLIEVSATGDLDAQARLLEVGRAALTDEGAALQLAKAMADVARTSPDELLLTMRSAPAPEAEAALTLLSQGLIAAAEPEHPFWPALKRAMGALDIELASFARRTESAMAKKIATHKAPAGVQWVDLPEQPASTPPPTTAETRPGG